MLKYADIKPRVYIETTVISHLVARPSNDKILAYWQKITRQLWVEYTDRFEFVISEIVKDEIQQGDVTAAKQRLEAVSALDILQSLPEIGTLVEILLDVGAVPRNSVVDAQHIAFAAVHGVDYLVSWNHKHLVNKNKRDHIKQVCQKAGFKPITICTPIELIEEIKMKETFDKHIDYDPETYTNPILEECYRIKAEINARYKTVEEFFADIKMREEENKRKGFKYVSYYDPEKHKAALKALEDV